MPSFLPILFSLPRTLLVFTLATLTPNSCSTASLICVLFRPLCDLEGVLLVGDAVVPFFGEDGTDDDVFRSHYAP